MMCSGRVQYLDAAIDRTSLDIAYRQRVRCNQMFDFGTAGYGHGCPRPGILVPTNSWWRESNLKRGSIRFRVHDAKHGFAVCIHEWKYVACPYPSFRICARFVIRSTMS
jgi:hypothetical protein